MLESIEYLFYIVKFYLLGSDKRSDKKGRASRLKEKQNQLLEERGSDE